MVAALYYPKANRTAQWFGDTYSGSLIDPDKVVWHTTETGGWPGYGGGASAPQLTYHADIHDWRQHYAANRSSRALRNEAGGVQTNTEDALQVEIVAYSDERLARARNHLPVSELDSEALDDLADFAAWAHREWGVPLTIDPGWLYIDFDDPPMSFDQWRAFAGHVGHNRVPENTHWDPARLDIDEITRRARGNASEPEDDMSVEDAKIGFAQALAEGARPADGDEGKTGRHVRDNLRAIVVPSVVEAVWEAEVGPDSNRRPLSHVLVGAEAKAAGALAAVEELAKQQGIDPTIIRQAVEEGVEEALVNLEVRFVVDAADPPAAPVVEN